MPKQSYKVGEAPWEVGTTAKKSYKVGEAPWEKQTPPPPANDEGTLQMANAAVNGAVNAGVLGYLPQIEGAVGAIPSLTSLNQDQITDAYVKRRDEAAAYQQDLQEKNPYAYGAGSLAGAIAVPVPGLAELQLAKNAGLAAKLGLAATKGAVIGGLANPGEKPGEDPTLQVDERLKNAAYGAAFGGAGEGLVLGIQNTPDKLQSIRRWMTAKQLGTNKGQLEKLLKETDNGTKLDELEKYMDKNGMLRMGTTFSNVADKSAELVDDNGKKIGNLYNSVEEKIRANPNVQIPDTALHGPDLANEFLNAEAQRLNQVHGGASALKGIANDLGNADNPVGVFNLGVDAPLPSVHKYRVTVDDQIPWNADTTGKLRAESNKKLRSFLNDKMQDRIGALDQATGEDNLSTLKSLNEDFSNAAIINQIANKTKAGEMSKYVPGLVGTVGGMGAGAYAHEHGKSLPEAALYGLGTGLALRGARAVAPAISYQGAKALQPAAQGAANYFSSNPVGSQMLVSPWIMMNQERNK